MSDDEAPPPAEVPILFAPYKVPLRCPACGAELALVEVSTVSTVSAPNLHRAAPGPPIPFASDPRKRKAPDPEVEGP